MKKMILAAAAALAMMATQATAGGFGFYVPKDKATASVDAGAYGGTRCSGHCKTIALADVKTEAKVDTSPPSANAKYNASSYTGGFGFAHDKLAMESVIGGDGEAAARASKRGAHASSSYKGKIASLGEGDSVVGHQNLSGKNYGGAGDSPRHDYDYSGAEMEASQGMKAVSSGGNIAKAAVSSSTELSVEADGNS